MPDLLDFFRISAVVVAAGLGLMCFYLTVSRSPKLGLAERLLFLGVVETTVFICVQEIEQIGHKFTWWRLPLLMAINITFAIGIWLYAKRMLKRR